jgi:kinesin family protein 4/21/27
MERLHEKQQVVLKRKVEEAKAINKRLQENLERSKKVKTIRLAKSTKSAAEKTEVIQTYIDHEIQVLFSNIDANITMQSLMNDRGMLTERLSNLKATVNKTKEIEDGIVQLEEDLEMRNAQIADIRQKLVQTDMDLKLKQIPENFETVPEFKIAMSYILRALTDSREDFTNTKTKAEDLRAAFEASEERIEQLTDEMHVMNENFSQARSQIEKDYEEKLTLLWQQKKTTGKMDDENAIDSALESLLTARTVEVEGLKARVAELEYQLKTSTRNANAKRQKNLDGTFTLKQDDDDMELDDAEEIFNSDEDYDFNDSFNDPEWRKTPISKRTRSGRGTTSMLKESLVKGLDYGLLSDICETSDTSHGTKRTSSGHPKCSCKGSCATKLCGCKKIGLFCSLTCKCSEACVNMADGSKGSDDGNGSGEIKMEKENVDSPTRDTTK